MIFQIQNFYFEKKKSHKAVKSMTNEKKYIYIRDANFYGLPVVHYGNLEKFSVFHGLQKTRIFLREFLKKVVIRNVAKKALNKRI